jgi:predicted transcriptional regulator of viral defense system
MKKHLEKDVITMNLLFDNLFDAKKCIFTTRDLAAKGLRSEQIKLLVESGELTKLRRGVYCRPDCEIDEFYLFQSRYSKGVYSYGTALFFHGLSNRVPNIISYTIPNHYNVSRIKTDLNVQYQFVSEQIIDLGAIEIKSFQGDIIRVYDMERTICDIIKNNHKIDVQIYTDAIKTYFSNSKINVRKLMKYAKILKVETDVLKYMEVLR